MIDVGKPTELEMRFIADGDGTRVELEHRGWERLGDGAAESQQGYDNGWPLVLGRYEGGFAWAGAGCFALAVPLFRPSTGVVATRRKPASPLAGWFGGPGARGPMPERRKEPTWVPKLAM